MSENKKYDLIIKGARIIDGTGNPSYFSDVAVSNGKIAKIAKVINADADNVIDAEGKVLSPGFIDAHSHHDMILENALGCESALEQGVTTQVVGMCGISVAPISEEHKEDCLFVCGKDYPSESIPFRTTMKDFLRYVDRPYGTNIAFLTGHGMLRANVSGYADRKLTKEELSVMRELLRESLAAGSFGLSFGLVYPPGSYADTEELINLAEVVAEYNGVITVHMRSEADKLIEAVEEMMEVTRATSVRMIISHHKACGGSQNWNKTRRTIEIFNEMIDQGYDVFCDQYPYTASSTDLKSNIPDHMHSLGEEKLIEMHSTKEGREILRKEIVGSKTSHERLKYVMIGWSESHPEYAGKMLNDIADELGIDPFDLECDLLRDDKLQTKAVFHTAGEEDIERVIRWPRAMVGTDGLYLPGATGGHPRSTATFPRILGRYVREKKILTLENAIRKMCYLPAMVYNFPTKGLIREGMDADLVIFDPDTICDNNSYSEPLRKNSGLDYVIVAGQIAVKDNLATGIRAGKQILKQN